jgi:RNA polymerase sigma-70 factor (ECF subfamily)
MDKYSNMHKTSDKEEAFMSLVRDHYSSIERYFQLWRCSPEESKDLTQETFLHAFHGLSSFRGEAKLGTWLVEIARNVLRNALRHKSAGRRRGQELSLDDTGSGAEEEVLTRGEAGDILEDLLQKEQRYLLAREIYKLPPQMRRCMLHRVQGLEYHEIATAMGISIQTVRSQLHLGKQRLKGSWS